MNRFHTTVHYSLFCYNPMMDTPADASHVLVSADQIPTKTSNNVEDLFLQMMYLCSANQNK